MNVDVKKAICLNENLPFPICHKCKKETSSYCITSEELNEIDTTTAQMLIDHQYLILNKIKMNEHLLFLCKHCITIQRTNNVNN